MKTFRVLAACEYSGKVRDAFSKRGFEAWSCDYLPSQTEGNHYQGNVLDILDCEWDLLIGFPPCTFLSYAGGANWEDEGRAEKRIEAAKFFLTLYNANAKHICIENPRGIMSRLFKKPDQELHPYFFGEREMKRTNLWLKNLPPLKYVLQEDLFEKRTASEKPIPLSTYIQKKTGKKKNMYFCNFLTKTGIKTGHERSITFNSIAEAMAEQWGNFLINSA